MDIQEVEVLDARDQCHQEQEADRLRLQAEIQEAWDHLMLDYTDDCCGYYSTDSDIKLLKWALGVK